MFRKNVVEKIRTHILCSVTFFFFENSAVCEIMWGKYCREGQGTNNNMAHARYTHAGYVRLQTQT